MLQILPRYQQAVNQIHRKRKKQCNRCAPHLQTNISQFRIQLYLPILFRIPSSWRNLLWTSLYLHRKIQCNFPPKCQCPRDTMKKTQRERILEKVRINYPCFGHFSIMNCMNLGFRKLVKDSLGLTRTNRCPLENSCKKESLKYAKECDPYKEGKIDKPRQWIRELEK